MKMRKTLVQMKQGETGTVVLVDAGRSLMMRLNNMGITVGTMLTKGSGAFLQGPVTVHVGNSQIALGYGMAAKIIVEEV